MLPASPSCSTSAGSPSPPSSPTEDNAAPLQMTPRGYDGAARDLPEYEYPVPFIIGDGFIDRKAQPVSLDELLVGRRVHSCPVGPPPGLYNQASTAAVADATATCWRSQDMQTYSGRDDLTPVSQKAQVKAPVLCLADALAEPEVGTPEEPTVGSKLHRFGTCKPCAFFHTKGCGNGLQCVFCHLCPAGEKKRRQKSKLNGDREIRSMHIWG